MSETEREIICRPIGAIRTPFTEANGAPIQSAGAVGVPGRVEVRNTRSDGRFR